MLRHMIYIKNSRSAFKHPLYDTSQTNTYGCTAISAARDLGQVDRVFLVVTTIEGGPGCDGGPVARVGAATGGSLRRGLGGAAGRPSPAAAHASFVVMAGLGRSGEVTAGHGRHHFENEDLSSMISILSSTTPKKEPLLVVHTASRIPFKALMALRADLIWRYLTSTS